MPDVRDEWVEKATAALVAEPSLNIRVEVRAAIAAVADDIRAQHGERIALAIETYLDPAHCSGGDCELCPLIRQLAVLARAGKVGR